MGKAKLSTDATDLLKKLKHEKKQQAGFNRQSFTGVAGGSSPVGGSGKSGGTTQRNDSVGFLPSTGGTITGVLALHRKSAFITANAIDVGSDNLSLSGITSYSLVTAGSSELHTISGAKHAGQILFLQANNGFTIKHGTGNISFPDAADLVVSAGDIVLLIFDDTAPDGDWRVVANYNVGGGGGGTEVPDWTEAHRANGYTLFLDADDNSNINAAVDNQVRIQTGGTTRMTWENSLITISDTVDVDPSSDGGVNLGSSSKQYGQVHSQTFSTWTDTTNDTTSTEAKIFRNSTRGLTFKSPSVGGSFGKHTFTDKDGVTRVEFDYNASSKLNNFNYSTQGLRVRKNADVGDTIDIVPPGNPLFGNNAYLNANGNAWTTSSPDDGLIISRVGLEKMKFTNSLIEVNEATDFSDEPISSVGEISFRLSTHKISSDFTGIDYETPSGDTHQFFVAGARIVTIKDTGIDLNDNEIIKPESGDVIGIGVSSVGATMSNVGSQGSLQIPYVVDIVAPTKAQLDSWFGNQDRCMGYALAAGPTLRLYVRESGVWRYFDADGFVS